MARKRRKMNFGAVTRQDFVALANIFCMYDAPDRVVDGVADYFKSQNSRFDTTRFKRATKTCRR